VAGLVPDQVYRVQAGAGRVTLRPGQGPGAVLTRSPAGTLAFLLPASAGKDAGDQP
jgi:hypothetical protein